MSCQVTVLMAVRNGGQYLRTAIDSILRQTYQDFRFLIVDDASSDDTREVVQRYNDERIELVGLDRNVGQTAALNIGLCHASTPWIARMDADDYSAPTRLEEQMRALDADRSLGCVGTFAWEFRDDPQVVEGTITKPEDHGSIRNALLREPPMIHASLVVSRTALLGVGAYDERYRYCADLDLYDRLLACCRAANIPKQLLGVRRHDNQASFSLPAIDERIQIFSRRFASGRYSSEEIAVIRASLCFCYLFRARHFGMERRYVEGAKDLLVAFRVSSRAFIRTVAGYLLKRKARRR